MSRVPRPYLPGTIFHLTTRTQGHEPWFTPTLRARIRDYIGQAFAGSDARLLAYALMPNHLHLVVQQGDATLGQLMQPLLRRIALLVQRSHGLVGHIFERRFRHTICHDPSHARTAIAYVHLNPVRGRMVAAPDHYPWTSHACYATSRAGPAPLSAVVASQAGLRLFAADDAGSPAQRRARYDRYIRWLLARDAYNAGLARGDDVGLFPPPAPPLDPSPGTPWSETYSPLFPDTRGQGNGGLNGSDGRPHLGGPGERRRRQPGEPEVPDLAEIARQTLVELGSGVRLEEVRSRCRRDKVVKARWLVVERMSEAGSTGVEIAGFLGLSQQCVSRIITRSRSRP